MAELRQQLIETARRMATARLNRGTAGNLSVRHGEDGDPGFLITPTGMAYDILEAADIVCMRLDGTAEGRRKPSSEWRFHRDLYAARLGVAEDHILELGVFRRSCDARKASAPTFSYSVDVALADEAALLTRFASDPRVQQTPDMRYHFVGQAPIPLATRPVVVGFGPAGIFAALVLAQSGFRPIVLERGKAVRERTQDPWGLWRKKVLDPESNVQFGEGGAGTFSDGKLYSQIKDPKHYGRKVLEEFVKAGAPAEILYVSKPHIGTFRLVGMVEQMRHEIEQLGGEIRFQQRVTGLQIEAGQVRGVTLASGEELSAGHVILALGHSARDTFTMLQRELDARAFELGGGTYEAPAQLVGDFLAGRPSTALGTVVPSYQPGVRLTDLASAAIREALPAFDRQIRGFAMPDAVLTGVETRTSSPLRITRGDDCQSVNVKGLYPAGEGAGYAGGILSAGVDGIRVAEAVTREMLRGGAVKV